MKLAIGTTLTCPGCKGVLDVSDPKRPGHSHGGPSLGSCEMIFDYTALFYIECKCGLSMFCGHHTDGWEYRVMV